MIETDEQLYTRFLKQRAESDIRILLERYREPLTFFINGIVHNRDDAEDLAMDCFAIIVSGTAHYHPRVDASFKTWLYAIAKKQAYMWLRRNKHMMSDIDEAIDTGEISSDEDMPESHLITDERNKRIYDALKRLNADYATALYLTYYEDMKVEQIARIMHKSAKQVYNLLSRGKTSLRELLSDEDL